MLSIRDLKVSIDGRPLLDGASVTIPTGKRVGLVGRNGSGKTTLFKVLLGEMSADSGEFETPSRWRIGSVAQEAPSGPRSLVDTVLDADVERTALMAEAETATDPNRIADIQTRLVDIDAHSAEARAAQILSGLGFSPADQARGCDALSGGWRMRVALAAALFAAPDLLLLDEPTNYLDLEGVVWLEGFLARYPHSVIAISHDRGLLNRAVQSILHLTERRLDYYATPYDQFDSVRLARLQAAASAKKKQEAARAHIQSFVDRFRAKASKARQAQARLKMLERMTPIVGPEAEESVRLSFPNPVSLAPPIYRLENVAVGYDAAKPVLSGLSLRIDPDDRIALLGANGQGKSTLAKLITGRLAPFSGEVGRHPKLGVGFFAQHQLDELTAGDSAVDHLRRLRPEEAASKLRARLGAVGLGDERAEAPVEVLSGGQKARLLLALAALDAPQMLVLDEPTNHLDIESREALSQALAGYQGAVILISHDPYLVESVADRLWLVDGGQVREFDGDIADYRAFVLSQRGAGGRKSEAAAAPEAAAEPRKGKRRSEAEKRKHLMPLRAAAAREEHRVAKLEEMRDLIARRLADPALYQGAPDKVQSLNRKRAEVQAGLERAESLWLAALSTLEEADAAWEAEG